MYCSKHGPLHIKVFELLLELIISGLDHTLGV